MNNFIVRFYQEAKQLGHETEASGKPVFLDVDMVEISIPGDMNNNITREVTEKDKRQFSAQYEAYKRGLSPSVNGTPLEHWPLLTPAQVKNYKAWNFETVEQIAEMSDLYAGKIGMGVMAHITAAKAYLKNAKDSALSQKQALEIERKDQQIADLQRQINELGARLDESPTKRGRPPKE